MDENEFYRLLSFLRLSPYRQEIVRCLDRAKEAQTPTDIANAIGIHRNHVSNHLSQMKEKGLVEVLNPESSRHRYYKLTAKGETFVSKAMQMDTSQEWLDDRDEDETE